MNIQILNDHIDKYNIYRINIKMYVRDNNISMFDKTNINKFIDFISLYTDKGR